jgi:DnaJ-domain-containing protein 1
MSTQELDEYNDRVIKIFSVAVIGLVVVPLAVGIYESWRKKQIAYSHNLGFIQSFDPLNLSILGWRVMASSHSSSSLETMPIDEIRKIDWKNLWPHQLDVLANRADFVSVLTDEELVELYRKIGDKSSFLTCLSSSQLLALLKNKSLTFEEKKEISQSVSGKQIDSVELLVPICELHTMSFNFDHYMYRREINIVEQEGYSSSSLTKEKREKKINESVNQIKTQFELIPNNVVVAYFQKFPLNPFHTLFFSADQIQLIDFASVHFCTTQSQFKEEGEHLSMFLDNKAVTPLDWFLQGCNVRSGAMSTFLGKDKNDDPEKNLRILPLEFSQNLSVKQVAFLALRTAMSDHDTLRQAFDDQKYDACFTKQAEFVADLDPSQFLKVYRIIDESNRPELIKHLTTRQLMALLKSVVNLDERVEISKSISGKQIDHVELLAQLCNIYTMAIKRDLEIYQLGQRPTPMVMINEIHTRFKAIPKVLVRFYFQKSGLNPFNFLFFSADQLQMIGFKRVNFQSIVLKKEGSNGIISREDVEANAWLEKILQLGRELLGTKYCDPSLNSGQASVSVAKTQLSSLSAKQVAFLKQRILANRIARNEAQQFLEKLFPDQVKNKDFEKYQGEFIDSNEDVSLPDLTISEAFAVLGLESGASSAEIKTQYRKISLQWHPDRATQEEKEKAEVEFKKVAAAYEFLTKMLEDK